MGLSPRIPSGNRNGSDLASRWEPPASVGELDFSPAENAPHIRMALAPGFFHPAAKMQTRAISIPNHRSALSSTSSIYATLSPKAYTPCYPNRKISNEPPRKDAPPRRLRHAPRRSHCQRARSKPTPSPDQRPRQCAGTIYVGGQTANPFTAKRTTKATTILPDGTKKLTELVEFCRSR